MTNDGFIGAFLRSKKKSEEKARIFGDFSRSAFYHFALIRFVLFPLVRRDAKRGPDDATKMHSGCEKAGKRPRFILWEVTVKVSVKEKETRT